MKLNKMAARFNVLQDLGEHWGRSFESPEQGNE
jgi:hypothetical protein